MGKGVKQSTEKVKKIIVDKKRKFKYARRTEIVLKRCIVRGRLVDKSKRRNESNRKRRRGS